MTLNVPLCGLLMLLSTAVCQDKHFLENVLRFKTLLATLSAMRHMSIRIATIVCAIVDVSPIQVDDSFLPRPSRGIAPTHNMDWVISSVYFTRQSSLPTAGRMGRVGRMYSSCLWSREVRLMHAQMVIRHVWDRMHDSEPGDDVRASVAICQYYVLHGLDSASADGWRSDRVS